MAAASGQSQAGFRSLAHHLLSYYLVPGFMDLAWDLAAGAEAFRQQSWFIRLGRGTALRALNLPLPLMRGMEHYARHSPDHYTATQALRFGETRGLGGSVSLNTTRTKGGDNAANRRILKLAANKAQETFAGKVAYGSEKN